MFTLIKRFSSSLFVLLLAGVLVVSAAAPSGGYIPSQTLNPDCAPLDPNCFVKIFTPPTGGTAGQSLTTDGSGVYSWTNPTASSVPATGVTGAADVTAGSTKITLGGTPTGAVLKPFTVDVNEGNLSLQNIGGALSTTQQGALSLGNIGGTLNLTSQVSGILPITNGGTGLSTVGTAGQVLTSDGTSLSYVTPTADWSLTGNAGTTPGTNFIGTTDAADLVVKTNNTEKLRITQVGRLLTDGTLPTNTIIGNTVGNETMTGAFNSVLGSGNTFSANTTGVFNTAIGYAVLPLNTTGGLNVGVGGASLFVNTTGNWNTAIGVDALRANTTGSNNVALGYRAGRFITTGTNNIAIGWDANIQNGTLNGQMNLGNIIYATGRGGIGVGSVGIGTVAPGNKLEIQHGTAGNSGLRFTNFPSIAVLATDTNGDVVSASLNPANGLFWGLTGNSGTNPTTNFIGTTDAQDFVTKTNNIERMRVTSAGNVGINMTSASDITEPLTVYGKLKMHAPGSYGSSGTWQYHQGGFFMTNSTAGIIPGNSYLYSPTSTASYYRLGYYGHQIATGPLENSNNIGFKYSGATTNTGLGSYTQDLLNFDGTINSGQTVDSTFRGLRTSLVDNSTRTNTLIGLSVDVSGGSNTTSNRYAGILMGGNVGIGATAPANKLEITHGTAGNSGLRFTNLTSVPLLATNSSGDVIASTLGNILPGGSTASQVLTSDGAGNFSWTTPTSGGITSLNGLTVATQTLALTNTPSAAGFTSTGTTHTLNLSAWGLTGNSGTTPGTNFIGTTDAQELVFKTNNIERGRLTLAGRLILTSGTSTFVNGGNETQTGNYNTALGVGALISNTTGERNAANGTNSLYFNTTGYYNAANGYGSLNKNTTGFENTASGYASLFSNTTGNYNTASGSTSLFSNTTGIYNTANGYGSLYSNTTGERNAANGANSLYYNTTGYYNAANGYGSLNKNTTGYENTANGYGALFSNIIGAGNTASGTSSLYFSTGNNNTAIGYNSGINLISGNNNIALGVSTNFASTTGSNQLNIANNIFGTGLNGTVSSPAGNIGIGATAPADKLQVLGDIRVGTAGTNGCLKDFSGGTISGTCSSDERLKTNITDITSILDRISQVRVVNYNWNDTAASLYHNDTTTRQTGYLAQNIASLFPELVITNTDGYQQVNYSAMGIYAIEAIRELSLKLDTGTTKVSDVEFALWTESGRITTYLDALNNESPRDVKLFLTEKMSTGYRAISNFTAERITAFNGYFENVFAKKVQTSQLCVDDVCVSRDQFLQMVNGSGASSTTITTTTSGSDIISTTDSDITVISDTDTTTTSEDTSSVTTETITTPAEAPSDTTIITVSETTTTE